MDIICYDEDGNKINYFYQWDYNRKISVSGIESDIIPQFHFCTVNSKEAYVVEPTLVDEKLEANVPNILLQQDDFIIIYAYEIDLNERRRTKREFYIPMKPRQKPSNYVFVDNLPDLSPPDGGGSGSDGATFTPSVEAVTGGHKLSWANNKNLPNPNPVTILDGTDGQPGAGGHTPVKGTDYWTAADQQSIVDDVLAALPEWTGGSY